MTLVCWEQRTKSGDVPEQQSQQSEEGSTKQQNCPTDSQQRFLLTMTMIPPHLNQVVIWTKSRVVFFNQFNHSNHNTTDSFLQ